mgnify:CR=1 FL=1
MIDTKFKDFFTEIDAIATSDNVDLIAAIVCWCEKAGVEVESIVSMVKSNPAFMSRMQEDAENLNFLRKTTRLPI